MSPPIQAKVFLLKMILSLFKRLLLVGALIIVVFRSVSAWDKIDFDQPPPQEMFPQWDAVILKDEGIMEIESNGEALFTQHRIIKIFSDPDKRYSHQEILFNSSIEVLDIEARTIHSNGDEFILNQDDIEEKSLISEFTLYSDVRAKEFYLPQVERNCLVEYKYKLRLKSLLYWSDWYFRSDLPSLYSGYTLKVPRNFNFRVKVLNAYIEPKIDFNQGKQIFLWEARDNQGIQKESFMPPAADSLSRLAFSSMEFNFDGKVHSSKSWDDVAAWYREISQPGINLTEETILLAAELTSGLSSEDEKIEAIFKYAQDHIRYVSITIGVGAYKPHPSNDVLEYGYGDCKDMTSLIITLLKAVDIEAFPALLSTKGHRSLLIVMPKVKQFDHVVVVIPGEKGYLWLDPACRNCRFGELPFEDQHVAALIVGTESGELVTTPETSENENVTHTRWEIKLNSDGSASGDLLIGATGQEELAFRASLTELKSQQKLKALTDFLGFWFLDPYLVSSEFINFEDRDSNINIQAGFLSSEFGVYQGDELFIPVNLNTQDYLSIMFPHQKRNHPVLFDYRFINQDEMTILIPPGFRIEHIPGAVRLDEPFGLFESTYRVEQDSIIHRRLFVRKQLLLSVDQYPQLKEFYDLTAQEDRKRIILKRRSDNE